MTYSVLSESESGDFYSSVFLCAHSTLELKMFTLKNTAICFETEYFLRQEVQKKPQNNMQIILRLISNIY
jgi:hypothetical protein